MDEVANKEQAQQYLENWFLYQFMRFQMLDTYKLGHYLDRLWRNMSFETRALNHTAPLDISRYSAPDEHISMQKWIRLAGNVLENGWQEE